MLTREMFAATTGDSLTATEAGGDLPTRQRMVYLFMLEFQRHYGLPPTVREIVGAFGFKSPNSAICHTTPLVKKGYVKQVGHKGNARSLVAIDPTSPETCECCGQALPQAAKGGA